MNAKNLSIGIILLMTVLIGCKKNKVELGPDVYIAGYQNGEPVYWKNGQLNKCPSRFSETMTIYKNDIYFPYLTGYFKNGIYVEFSHATYISQFKLYNDTVYALGSATIDSNYCLGYWKNNQFIAKDSTMIFPFSTFYADMAFLNEEVVLGGIFKDSIGYWVNGIFNPVYKKGQFGGITVSGNDIYIFGKDEKNIPAYWKNGKRHDLKLPDSLEQKRSKISMGSLLARGDDVYFVTSKISDNWNPLYWKNGEPIDIDTTLNRYIETSTSSIFVHNNDVYVVGYEVIFSNGGIGGTTPIKNALMWRNGIKTVYSLDSWANKIIVQDKL